MREQSNAGPDPDEVFRATPEVCGGVACFTGTRVGVSQLLGYLRDGHTIDDFLNDFPTITRDQAQRAIERIDNEYIRGMERDCTGEYRQGQDRGAEDGGFRAQRDRDEIIHPASGIRGRRDRDGAGRDGDSGSRRGRGEA